jgi:hypothetical protein
MPFLIDAESEANVPRMELYVKPYKKPQERERFLDQYSRQGLPDEILHHGRNLSTNDFRKN